MINPIQGVTRMRAVAVRLVFAVALVALLGAAGAARADNPVLTANVGAGDSFAISLTAANGAAVKHVDAGTYTLVVHDHSSLHNFRLSGPGVEVASGIDTVGDETFAVTLVDGTYFFQCDAHVGQMHGSFTVGAVTGPPPPTKLVASLGPGAAFKLSPTSGLAAGTFSISVADRSTSDGFRLSGPGIAKSTGVKFRGSVTWKVTLKTGRYSYGSVKKPKLRRSFTVS